MDKSRRKVLIIDDDPRNTFALGLILRSRNFDCLNAQDAATGLSLLDAHPGTGAVLLDMMMPGLDGYETIGLIRDKTAAHAVPIIAVTAQAMPGDREKCLAAGADEYVCKPVDVDKLMQVLNQKMR